MSISDDRELTIMPDEEQYFADLGLAVADFAGREQHANAARNEARAVLAMLGIKPEIMDVE